MIMHNMSFALSSNFCRAVMCVHIAILLPASAFSCDLFNLFNDCYNLQAISIPEVEQIIQTKWERVGYPFFILSFLINTLLTICITLILVLINATPQNRAPTTTEMGANFLYFIVALAFFVMFLQEMHDFAWFGWQQRSFRGVALFDKILRVIKILSFVTFCCFKAYAAWHDRTVSTEPWPTSQPTSAPTAGNSPYPHEQTYDKTDQGIKLCIVVCVIASYFHLYYFFMGFDSTGPFVLTLFRIIAQDVPYFMQFYFINVLATACALSVLRHDRSPGDGGFFLLVRAIWTLIQDTVGIDATHDVINDITEYPKYLQWMADIILTCYYITVIILMLNLLIAMISNTYAAYCEYNGAILLIAKYNIMDAMETVMWPQELKENRAKYAQINEQMRLPTLKSAEKDDVKSKPSLAQQLYGVVNPLAVYSAMALTPRKPITVSPGTGAVDGAVEMVPQSTHSDRNASPSPSSRNSRRRADTTMEIRNSAEIDERVLVRYLFELQTVNHAWYGSTVSGNAVGSGASGSAGVALDSAKIAEAVAAALGGKTLPALASTAASADGDIISRKTTLFIIDPQVDFHPGGSLAIPAAAEDSVRIGKSLQKM
jgi:hypothetical protein